MKKRNVENQQPVTAGKLKFMHHWYQVFKRIRILMGLLRGAVFLHTGVPENSPLASMVRFPLVKSRFPAVSLNLP